MLLCPLNSFTNTDTLFLFHVFGRQICKLPQTNLLSPVQLHFPQSSKLITTQGFLFSRSLRSGQLLAHILEISASEFRFIREQFGK